jgi:hypothetical protein
MTPFENEISPAFLVVPLGAKMEGSRAEVPHYVTND